MKKVSSIWFFALMVFALPAIAWALVSWYEKKVERLPVLGRSKEHRIADFQLSNQDYTIKKTADWKDKIVVVDFFFTHCPVICPKMTNSLKKVQAAWQGDKEILINSFTVDPERDSVAQLKKYCRQFGINTTNWDLLTGDKKDIYKLARNSFMIVATDGDGGPDDFIHSDKLVLIDKQKRIRGYYDGTSNEDINHLITDIKKVKDEN
ncbi:MAG TPA: SCO family protein [Chitinophagaceae bacterium]